MVGMEKRICSQCKNEKLLTEEFFLTKDKLGKKFTACCRLCQNVRQSESYKKKRDHYKQVTKDYRKKLRAENQKLLWEFYKDHPCVRCGETNPVVLELDHLGDKKHQISDIIYCHKWESVSKEIEKCQVLCSNCHAKKTAKDLGWYLYIDGIEEYL